MPVVIQMTNDEKFFHSPKLTLEKTIEYGIQNIKDIIAVGIENICNALL